MADITDKFTFVALETKTSLAAPYTVGDTSINCDDLSAWASAGSETAVFFGMDRVTIVDGKEQRVDGTYTEWKAVQSGNTLGSLELIKGNDQDYPAGSTTRVYMTITASWANSIVEGLLVALNKNGSLRDSVVATLNIIDAAVTAVKLASNAVTTSKVADGAVTTPKLADGAVTSAKMFGIDLYGHTGGANGGTPPAAGSGQFYLQIGSTVGVFSGNALDVTYPTPFPNGTMNVLVCDGDNTGFDKSIANATLSANGFRVVSGANGLQRVTWWAVGW